MLDFAALCVENSTSLSYIDIGIVAVVLLFAVPAAFKGLCGGLERGCFGQFMGVVLSLALAVVLVFGVKGVGPFVKDIAALDGVKSQVSSKIETANPKYSLVLERKEDGLLYVTDADGNETSVARVFVPVENEKIDSVVETLDKLISTSFSDEVLASYEGDATIGKLLGETVIKLLLRRGHSGLHGAQLRLRRSEKKPGRQPKRGAQGRGQILRTYNGRTFRRAFRCCGNGNSFGRHAV